MPLSRSRIIVVLRRCAGLARHADRGRCRRRSLTALSAAGRNHRHRASAASRHLPLPALPAFSLAKMQAVLPDAIAFALLGAIESLLSAVVADGMTGRRHRSNCELVAQGVANIGSALFGGICVTGTIARTATNVRAGARGPVAGMLHSVFLLLFMLIAAPLASYIPLAALAGGAGGGRLEHGREAGVRDACCAPRAAMPPCCSSTFLLTIFRDLTEGILVGFALGAVLFINRMAKTTAHRGRNAAGAPRTARTTRNGDRVPYDSAPCQPTRTWWCTASAVRFSSARHRRWGRCSTASPTPARRSWSISRRCRFSNSTAANAMSRVATNAKRQGIRLFITGASPTVRRVLLTHGVTPSRAKYRETIARAITDIKRHQAAHSA